MSCLSKPASLNCEEFCTTFLKLCVEVILLKEPYQTFFCCKLSDKNLFSDLKFYPYGAIASMYARMIQSVWHPPISGSYRRQ